MLPPLLMLVSHAGAWAFALALAGRFTPRSTAGTVAAAGLLHTLAVSVAVLAALGAGAFGLWALAGAGAVAWAGAFALGGPTFWRPHLRAATLRARSVLREAPVTASLALALLALALLRSAVVAWLCPPIIVDEAAYHLPKLVSWVQTGGFHRPLLADTRTWFPGGMQFLQAWWVGFLHHDVLIEGASTEMAFVGAAATAALARSLGLRRSAALFAAALFATVPAVLAQSSSAMNDLAAGTLLLTAFAFAVRRPWTLAAVAAALGAGVKPTVLFALPAVALAAVSGLRSPRSAGPRLLHALSLAAALAVGSLWYLLNAAEAGNPFHPVSIGPGTSQQLGPIGSTVSRGPSAGRFLRNARELFTDRAFAIDGRLTAVTDARLGWGWTATLLALPALAWLLWRHPRSRLPVGAASVGAALTLLMVEYDPWNARFILWLSAAPCIAVAGLAPGTRLPTLAAALAAAGSLANLAQNVLPPAFESREAFSALMSHPWRERDMLRCIVLRDAAQASGTGMEAYREQLLAGSPILVVAGGSPVAALARGDYSRRLEFSPADNPADIPGLARELRCDVVFSQDGNGVPLPPVWEAVKRGGLVQIAPGWYRMRE